MRNHACGIGFNDTIQTNPVTPLTFAIVIEEKPTVDAAIKSIPLSDHNFNNSLFTGGSYFVDKKIAVNDYNGILFRSPSSLLPINSITAAKATNSRSRAGPLMSCNY